MAIVIIKDSEKNNKRFVEKRSKLINDQVDIVSESELGQLLTQEQAPVSETINSAVDSERTVVAHFLLGHKKDIYMYGNIRKDNSIPLTFGGLLPYTPYDPTGEVNDGALSTANEYLLTQPSERNHWGISVGTGLNSYLYNSGVLRNVQYMVETFADYNPFLHDISLNGFAIDEMYVDRNVIKNIHIAPQLTGAYGLTNRVEGDSSSQQSLNHAFGILGSPSNLQLKDTTTTGGSSDISSGGVYVSFEFNTDSEDLISAPLITGHALDGAGNVSTLTYQDRFVNLTTGETKSSIDDYYPMLDASAEKITKQTRDFKAGYRYFFEVKKHTIPTLEYAQNRNFITKNAFMGGSLNVLLATLDPVPTTTSGVNLLYDQGFVRAFDVATPNSFQINSTPSASTSTINLSNGDVWNMKSGALVASVVPAALPNELSVHSFVTRAFWNPVFMYEYFGKLEPGLANNPGLLNQKDYANTSYALLMQLYKDKANMPDSFSELALETFEPLFNVGQDMYAVTGQLGVFGSGFADLNGHKGITMNRFSTMGALEFLFTMSGQSDILDTSTSAFSTSNDDITTTSDTLTSSVAVGNGSSTFTFTDRFGQTRTVIRNASSGGLTTNSAPKVFTANRASTAAEIYEVKIVRYPSATVDISNPIYSEASGAYGGYGYDGYGYSGGASATVIGYDTFKENVVDKYTIAGVPFSVGTWAKNNGIFPGASTEFFQFAGTNPFFRGAQILDWDGGTEGKKAIFVY